MEKRKIIIISVLALVVIFVVSGFFVHPETLVINRIETSHSIHVVAEYSETTFEVDLEGQAYTDTDYWTETVSDEYILNTLTDYSGQYITSFYGPEPSKFTLKMPKPPITYDHSKVDFDRYSIRSNLKIKVWLDLDSNFEDYVSVPEVQFSELSKRIGDSVVVKKWYGYRRKIQF